MSQADNQELKMIMEKCGHFLYHRRGDKRGQRRILGILLEEGEMTQKELQDRLGIQPGSMSEIVAKIEGKGLIFRMKDEMDRRKIKLTITEKGRHFYEEKMKERMEEERRLFDALSTEQQEELQFLLTKLFESWEANFDQSLFEHRKECRKRDKEK